MKECVVICNLNSGRGIKKSDLKKIDKLLKQNNYKTVFLYTKYKGHANEMIRNISQVDLVISIGGDGTFNEVMSGNIRRKEQIVLAHLPTGTTNDIGAMYGYGKNLITNVKNLLTGEIKDIDICLLNNEPFVYVAGFGKFTDIPYNTSSQLKKRYGYIAYLFEGIKNFFNRTKLHELSYIIDGKEYNGLFSIILISNANRIAGIDNFYKEVKLDDDCFEVLLCNLTKKTDIIKSWYYLTTNKIEEVPGFYFHKTNNIEIIFKNKKKITWCLDGEKLDQEKTSFKIKVLRNVKILMPKKNIKKLFLNN